MRAIIDLPPAKEVKQVIRALDRALTESEVHRNVRSVEWLTAKAWLEGVRDFGTADYDHGRVKIGFRSVTGDYRFRYEIALAQMQIELGRLQRLKLRPRALPIPTGLEAVRKSAMANVVFDFVLPKERLEAVFKQAQQFAVQYGPVAIRPVIDQWPDGTPIYDLEVIPPWELGSMPAEPKTPAEVGAVTRDHWVPISFLVASGFLSKKKAANAEVIKELKARRVIFGTNPNESIHGSGDSATLRAKTAFSGHEDGRVSEGKGSNTDTSLFVRLVEVWVKGPADTLARYIAKAGRLIFTDKTFGDEEWKATNPDAPRPPPFPIGLGGYYPTSGLYMRGFIGPQIAVNHEIERTLGSVFKGVRDHDQYGLMAMPSNLGINKRELRVSKNPKMVIYEPDHVTPELGPKQFRPVSAGPLAGQVANLTLQLGDKLSNQGNLFSGQAPGRVDSQVGLDFLFQTQAIPLDVVGSSLAAAFTTAYAAILYEAKIRIGQFDKVQLTRIDDAVAGIILDPATGEVSISDNGIPWPHEVTLGVESVSPQPPEAVQGALFQHLQAGLISQLEYWVSVFQEGLDLPSMKKGVEAAVEKATLNNIVLFGDGETPGEVWYEPDADNAEVFLLILSNFIAKAMWGMAAPEVQEMFYRYRDDILSRLPTVLPESAPSIEEAAEQPSPDERAQAAQKAG